MQTHGKPALFLDRDGVVNVDKGYVHKIDDFEWIEGAPDCIVHFNQLGWWVIVVTNQSGIARGRFTEHDLRVFHRHISEELRGKGAWIDAFYHASFLKGAPLAAYDRDSALRKPAPGMLLQAMEAFPIDASRSMMIGDKASDVEAGARAGVNGHLFKGGNLFEFATALVGSE